MKQRFYLEVVDPLEVVNADNTHQHLGMIMELTGLTHGGLEMSVFSRVDDAGINYGLVQYTLECDIPIKYNFGVLLNNVEGKTDEAQKALALYMHESIIANLLSVTPIFYHANTCIIGRVNVEEYLIADLDQKFRTRENLH